MLCWFQTHHHLLSQRALAYFDVSQLVTGKDVVTARVSPGLYQVLNEVTMGVSWILSSDLLGRQFV